ncbi:MAG: hypothetical protein WBC04_23535 [Candidatus Acidiferrales bacterium]|jgi:hypothetical protein
MLSALHASVANSNSGGKPAQRGIEKITEELLALLPATQERKHDD